MAVSLFSSFTRRLGIDLGTNQTRIWLQGKGLVLNEPTLIAVDEKSGKVVAVGQDAAEMEGRVESSITVFRPMERGKLANAELARAMLRVWLQQILGFNYVLSPVVMVSVPASSTPAARQAVTELIYDLGAREVYTIVQPLAAAIGAGVPVADASGTLLCQLGGGVVEAALISLGGLVRNQSSKLAGNELDQSIQLELRQNEELLVSLELAQQLKAAVAGGPGGLARGQSKLVTGQDLSTNAPKELEISTKMLEGVVLEYMGAYERLIEDLLADIPPQLTVDVLDKGMLLSGGMAQLAGLEQFLVTQLGIPVAVIEQPELAVINGIGAAIDHLGEYRQSLAYQGRA